MTSIPVNVTINLELEPDEEIVKSIGHDPTAHGFDVWAVSAIGRGATAIKRVIARVLLVPKDVYQPRYRQPGKWRIKPGSLAYELAHARPEDVKPARRRKAA